MVVFHWDGKKIPPELKKLPPGRYVVESAEGVALTPEEERGIEAAIRQLDAGKGRSLSDVLDELTRAARKR